MASTARATTSLRFALDSDELPRFCETLNEGQAAAGDFEEVRESYAIDSRLVGA